MYTVWHKIFLIYLEIWNSNLTFIFFSLVKTKPNQIKLRKANNTMIFFLRKTFSIYDLFLIIIAIVIYLYIEKKTTKKKCISQTYNNFLFFLNYSFFFFEYIIYVEHVCYTIHDTYFKRFKYECNIELLIKYRKKRANSKTISKQ